MAEQVDVGSLLVKLEAETSGIRASLDKVLSEISGKSKAVAKEMGTVEGAVDSVIRKFFGMGETVSPLEAKVLSMSKAFLAFGAVEEIIRRSITAFAEAEMAAVRLDTTLGSMGRNAAVLSPLLQNLAGQGAAKGIFSKNDIVRGQEMLATFSTISDIDLSKLTPTLLDLGAKTGSVTLAARLLGLALEGNTGVLRRYGISIDESVASTGDMDKILAEIRPKIAGMNEALGSTAQGQMIQFKNAINDLLEVLGELVVTPLLPWLEGLKRVLAALAIPVETFMLGLRSAAKTVGFFAALFTASSWKERKEMWEAYMEDMAKTTEAASKKMRASADKVFEGTGVKFSVETKTDGLLSDKKELSDQARERNKQFTEMYLGLLKQQRAAEIGMIDNQREAAMARVQLQDEERRQRVAQMRLTGADAAAMEKFLSKTTAAERRAVEHGLQKQIRDIRTQQRQAALGAEASITDDKRKQANIQYEISAMQLQEQMRLWREAGIAQEEVNQMAARQFELLNQQRIRSSRTAAEIVLDDWSNTYEQLNQAAAGWLRSTAKALEDFVFTGKLNFRDLAESIIRDLIRIRIQEALTNVFRGVQAAAPNFFGNIASVFTGARAGGGAMSAGVPYLAGERGPELIVPAGPSTAIPSSLTPSALGGGQTVVVNQSINVSAGVSQTVRAEMLGMLPAFKEQAKTGVLDAIYSGGEFARAVGRRK